MIINKNYTKLITATFITRLGDSIDAIAFSWLVYIMTGSRTLMGGIFVMSVLPNLIILPFAGVFADIFNKKVLVVLSDFLRGSFVLVLAVFYFTGILEVWHLFAFVFINNVFESVANPSRGGMLQSVIDEEHYIKGNSYLSSASSFGSLVGLGIAGILIGVIGISGAIIIDSVTFFVSAVLISSISFVDKNGKVETEKQTVKMYFSMIKEGFSFLRGKGLLVSLLVLGAFINLAFTPFNVLEPVYVDEVMNLGVEGLTYLGIALSLGMIVGGIVMGQLADKVKPINAIGVGLGMMGVMYLLLGLVDWFNLAFIPNIVVIVVFTFLFTFFLPVMQAPVSGTMMRIIPPHLIGRMMSTFSIFSLSAMPLGGLLVSIIGNSISVPVLYVSMGLFIVLISSLYWVVNRHKDFEKSVV